MPSYSGNRPEQSRPIAVQVPWLSRYFLAQTLNLKIPPWARTIKTAARDYSIIYTAPSCLKPASLQKQNLHRISSAICIVCPSLYTEINVRNASNNMQHEQIFFGILENYYIKWMFGWETENWKKWNWDAKGAKREKLCCMLVNEFHPAKGSKLCGCCEDEVTTDIRILMIFCLMVGRKILSLMDSKVKSYRNGIQDNAVNASRPLKSWQASENAQWFGTIRLVV